MVPLKSIPGILGFEEEAGRTSIMARILSLLEDLAKQAVESVVASLKTRRETRLQLHIYGVQCRRTDLDDNLVRLGFRNRTFDQLEGL